ncbi:formin-2-like [Pollicipes pollicipes]|uniref:formin-2-like n=1 Tax=Pollicipes pollicipes TaxID=41117 RepID=UPI001884C6B1|nr:formin-2-like [Pollicipes pollicipes]
MPPSPSDGVLVIPPPPVPRPWMPPSPSDGVLVIPPPPVPRPWMPPSQSDGVLVIPPPPVPRPWMPLFPSDGVLVIPPPPVPRPWMPPSPSDGVLMIPPPPVPRPWMPPSPSDGVLTAGSFLPVSVPVSTAVTPGITISMPVLEAGGACAESGSSAGPPVLHIPEERTPSPANLAPPPETDFSLNGTPSDVLMDVTLANSNSSFTGFLASFGRGGADPAVLQTPTRPLYDSSLPQTSPPASPRVWSEIGDFSLSSILGHLETSKPASKEALVDPSPELDERAVAGPISGSDHGLPTSFEFAELMTPGPGEPRPLASSQSPPT